MSTFTIRDAKLPEERSVLVAFILALQHFEHDFESDRRLDPPVAEEHFDVLMSRVGRQNGHILVADSGDGRLLGWTVVYEDRHDDYVVPEERLYGYVAELYVVEQARGQGVGKALLEAGEAWARTRSLRSLLIGVIPTNRRAAKVYGDAGFTPYAVTLRKYL